MEGAYLGNSCCFHVLAQRSVSAVEQLKPGGRMVIPVGTAFLTQHLMLVEKRRDGSVVSRQILPVQFVPLTGGH